MLRRFDVTTLAEQLTAALSLPGCANAAGWAGGHAYGRHVRGVPAPAAALWPALHHRSHGGRGPVRIHANFNSILKTAHFFLAFKTC